MVITITAKQLEVLQSLASLHKADRGVKGFTASKIGAAGATMRALEARGLVENRGDWSDSLSGESALWAICVKGRLALKADRPAFIEVKG